MHLDITTEDIRWNCLHNKQAVGGRPPRYAPVQACDGSAQRQPWARPISQYALSAGWPHTPPADRMYATDVRRQTDVRQHHRLMPPGRGHNKFSKICLSSVYSFLSVALLSS